MRALSFLGAAGGALVLSGLASAQCPNPISGADVIVGEIPGITVYNSVNGMGAYALGTTSCNVGDAELLWFANNTNHPVIGQNIYRLEDGRFEQIGMSWLKHGFTALQQNLCCSCDSSGTGTRLGVGCSDPYSSGLNGSQGGLGPRSEVNAFTGAFAYPYLAQGQQGDSVYKRIQIPVDDVAAASRPNAVYFGEAQYVAPDDAAAGNGFNNVSYCRLNRPSGTVGGTPRLRVANGSTVRESCAIDGWAAADTSVVTKNILVPGEGLFCAGSNAVDLGNGFWTYNYAVFNNNSDFSGQSFSVPFGNDVTIVDVGMSFPMYHSGEPYTNVEWTPSVSGGAITWQTETFGQNANANALRWGTTYSFWFTANAAPTTVNATLGLFKPGNPGDQSAQLVGPGDGSGGGVFVSEYCAANANSTGGITSIAVNNVDLQARTMDLEAADMPSGAFGFFITSTTQAFVPNAGGSAGNLCVGGQIGRGVGNGILSTGALGAFSTPVSLDSIPTPTGFTSVMAGETRNFQAWHRDSIIGIATSNFSGGLAITFP